MMPRASVRHSPPLAGFNCNPERDNPSTLSNTILSKIRIYFLHQAGCMNEKNATEYWERDWE
jgi:hypothetical protein